MIPPFDPRLHQIEARRGVYRSWRAGHSRVVLVLPTAGGKTFCGGMIVKDAVSRGHRVLWLAHRTELIDQACADLASHGLDVGAISPSAVWPANRDAPVQVASVQTLAVRDTLRPPADLIVWDECHHASDAAETWLAILDAYPMVHILGLTATPERGDGTGLAPLFTDLVVGATTRQLTELGILVPCEIVRPPSWLKAGRVAGNPLAQEPLDSYKENARQQGTLYRQGIAFAATVEEAEAYARQFTEHGIRSFAVSAKTPKPDRDAALAAFRAGDLRVLWNVYVFTEGTNLPMAEVCMLACHPGTAGGFIQRVGRVLRSAPGKKDALLLDLPGSTWVHGAPEDERIYQLEGKAICRAEAKCAVCKQPIVDYPCANCGYAPDASEGRETGATEILNVKMERFKRKLAAGPEQRKETVLRWMAECAYKDRAPGAVRFRFRNAYGIELTATEYMRGLGDLTHDLNPIVSEWARKHLGRIAASRAARRAS